MTIVTDEVIRNKVFNVARGTFKISAPLGHVSTPVRKKMYAENKPPNSMTSEAKKSQTPNFPL